MSDFTNYQKLSDCLTALEKLSGEFYHFPPLQFLTSVMRSLEQKPWLIMTGSRHSLGIAKNLALWMNPRKVRPERNWQIVTSYTKEEEDATVFNRLDIPKEDQEHDEESSHYLQDSFFLAEKQPKKPVFAIVKGMELASMQSSLEISKKILKKGDTTTIVTTDAKLYPYQKTSLF